MEDSMMLAAVAINRRRHDVEKVENATEWSVNGSKSVKLEKVWKILWRQI